MLTRFKQAEQNTVPEVLAAQPHIRAGTLSAGNGTLWRDLEPGGETARCVGGGELSAGWTQQEGERGGLCSGRGDSKEGREGGFSAGGETARREMGLFNGRGDIKEGREGDFSVGGVTARRERGAFQRAGRQQGGERGAFQRWGDSKGERKGVVGVGLFAGRGDRKGVFSAAGKKRVLIEGCSTQTAIEAFVSKSSSSSALRGSQSGRYCSIGWGRRCAGLPPAFRPQLAPPQSGTPAAPSGGCDQTVTC